MGMLRAIGGAVGGTLADQWKDVITAGRFDEHSAVVPGVLKDEDNGRGSNGRGSEGVITNGSKIYVPENTAAFIFNQSGIENIISQPCGYEYHDGQESIFNGDGVKKSIFKQIGERIGYGGITSDYKQIAFVNLREIRDIKFGTRGPLMYNDVFMERILRSSPMVRSPSKSAIPCGSSVILFRRTSPIIRLMINGRARRFWRSFCSHSR